MSKQLDFFSASVSHVEKATQAIIEFDFDRAQWELRSAYEIDPYTVNLGALFEIIEFFKECIDAQADLGENLATLWWRIPNAVIAKQLTCKQAQLTDQYITKIAIKKIRAEEQFIDEKKKLPWGALFIVDKEYTRARKLLMQTIECHPRERADLWCYYADACYLLGRHREARAAYVKAMLINSRDMDFFRLRNENFRDIYEKLLLLYPREQAQAMFLFQLWMSEVLELPDFQVAQIEALIGREKAMSTAGQAVPDRLHHFCLCFVLAQELSGDEKYLYREKMQQLAPELFDRYINRLKRDENRLSF